MRMAMKTYDVNSLFHLFLRKFWIVAITAVLFSGSSFLISQYLINTVYRSDTTLYIGKNLSSDSGLEYNDLLIGSQLVEDYRELIKSRLVVNEVMRELSITGVSAEVFSAKINVALKNNTRVIQISASDASPDTARTIADKVTDVFVEKVDEIMQVDYVKVIDRAETPQVPVKPNKALYTAAGFILGAALSFGIIFLVDFFDNSVKTAEDIGEFLNLPVIGTIPVFPKK